MGKIRQWYGDLKLQSKFTLVLILIVAIPAVMFGFFFYSRIYEMVVSYTIKQEQDSSAQTAPLIEAEVQEVLDTFARISSLDFYQTLFEAPVEDSLDTLAASQQAAEFCKKLRDMTKSNLVADVQIYIEPFAKAGTERLPDVSPLFQEENTRSVFSSASRIMGTYWHGIFQGSAATELFCPPFYLGTQEQKTYGDLAYIKRCDMEYQGERFDAYVAVYYSSSSFCEILSDNLALDGSVSYIINERNNLVASSNSSLSGIYWLDYDRIMESFIASNNFLEQDILGQTVYVGFYRISQTGWFMVTVLPSQPLIWQSNVLVLQFLLIYLGILVLAFLLASVLSRSITNRISSVISQMRTVRQGPPVPMDSPVYHDEIGDLIDTYNYMTRKMNELMEKQVKAAEDLRIVEFNSLQAQINPHFLYNTMDMISWMAQQGRTSEIRNAVQSLSRFYKLTLSRKQSISTIAQEEEHVSIYVHLQNMRFHDSISFISDIPDELMEQQIPKLTLQPVVENAILHGILEKPSKEGTIVLTGWMDGEDIVLLISDDGVGISPEKLPAILSGEGAGASGGTNIAIYNTHRRLMLLYGEGYGLSYSSAPGTGTEVQIRIPARKISQDDA